MRKTQEAITGLALGKRPAEELYALRSDRMNSQTSPIVRSTLRPNRRSARAWTSG
jgi:hypothetical protein